MSEHACLVDLHLPEPRLLVDAGEDLDRHVLTPPLAPPNLAKPLTSRGLVVRLKVVLLFWVSPSLANHLLQLNLPRYGSLQQKREPRPRAGAGHRQQVLCKVAVADIAVI